MTEFEDNLWRELEDTYGPELREAEGPLHLRSRLRTPAIAGTSLGVVGAGTAAVIVLTAGSAAPAFAVTSHRDGSVSVVIRRIDAIPGANQRLAQLGIRARAVQVAAGCRAKVGPVAGVPVMTLATARHKSWVTATPGAIHARISPAEIPRGRTLVIPAVRAGAVVRLAHARVVNGAIPKCLRPAVKVGTAAASGPVRIISCRPGIVVRPVPAMPTTANNTTNTNAAAAPKTVTEVVPAPARQVNTNTNAISTNTNANSTSTDQTATGASGATTNWVPAPTPGRAGPIGVNVPAPQALLRACQLAARAAK